MLLSSFLALLSGALVALPFSFPSLWPLSWLSLAAFFIAINGVDSPRRALWLGCLASISGLIGMMYWINYTIVVYGNMNPAVSGFMFILYMIIFGTKFPLLGLALLWLRPFPPLLTYPLAVMAAEMTQFSLFPWYFGSNQAFNLYFVQAADLVGVAGLSWFVALGAVLISETARLGHVPMRGFIIVSVVLISVYGYGIARLRQIEALEAAARPIRVALVQPNTPLRFDGDASLGMRVLETCTQLSLAAGRTLQDRVDLVVWPEGGTPFSFNSRNGTVDIMFRQTVDSVARQLNSNVLFYDLLFRGERPFNNVWLLDRQGAVLGNYQKIMLLAFGEYIPFADTFKFLQGFGGVSQHQRGQSIHVLKCDAGVLAPLICYEILYPGFVRSFVGLGAEYIINVTNDAWFGPTTASMGHLLDAYPRAVENRRPMVRCTNSGVSVVVAASGRFQTPFSPQFQQTYQVAELRSPKVTTLYTRFGDVFGWCCTFLFAILLAAGLRRRRA